MRDPGSFRDPSGFVFFEKNKVFRSINISYKNHFKFLMSSGLYDELIKNKMLVQHSLIKKNLEKEVFSILEVEKIFPIIYPYEWSFSQLQDAAILTLEIQKIAVNYRMTLKDASPYNVQFKDNKPVFIDTLSFEMIKDEDYAWTPYKQFCEMFLSPLCLMSYLDPNLNKLLINYIDGIPLGLTNKLMPFKNKLNPSVFLNLVLPNLLKSNTSVNVAEKKINKKQHLNIIDQLLNFIKSLSILKEESEWGEYNIETISEKKEYVKDKEETVSKFLSEKTYSICWDIGANDGYYSRKVQQLTKSHVISLDIDWQCVEKNYIINKKNSQSMITPVLFDLSNPSPGIGWMNNERTDIFYRIGPPNLICMFAVIHHVINRNIPIEMLIDFISKTSTDALIEYIPFSDPKCKIIFKSRPKDFYYPSENDFENKIKVKFEIIKRNKLAETNRVLYLLRKKK